MSATTQTVPAGTYTLDPVHSTFGFAVKHNNVSTFRGTFEQVDAKLENGVLVGTAQVDSVKTVIPDLKGHLVSPDFFNAEQTPTITFRSTDIRVADDGTAEVDGDLTIRGITKPVTAKGTFGHGVGISGAEVAGLDLEVAVDRRDFGLNWNADLPAGGQAVAWDVKIEAHLEMPKAEA
jgi:polyisoprenoid-binding protein YceI